jgi:hypothetical protein
VCLPASCGNPLPILFSFDIDNLAAPRFLHRPGGLEFARYTCSWRGMKENCIACGAGSGGASRLAPMPQHKFMTIRHEPPTKMAPTKDTS